MRHQSKMLYTVPGSLVLTMFLSALKAHAFLSNRPCLGKEFFLLIHNHNQKGSKAPACMQLGNCESHSGCLDASSGFHDISVPRFRPSPCLANVFLNYSSFRVAPCCFRPCISFFVLHPSSGQKLVPRIQDSRSLSSPSSLYSPWFLFHFPVFRFYFQHPVRIFKPSKKLPIPSTPSITSSHVTSVFSNPSGRKTFKQLTHHCLRS